MSQESLSLASLQVALERCMVAHPPTGPELTLSPEANTLADLWATMLVERRDVVAMVDVDARVLEVYARWSVSA